MASVRGVFMGCGLRKEGVRQAESPRFRQKVAHHTWIHKLRAGSLLIARVVELAYTTVLEAVAARRAGSNPVPSTTFC